MYTHKITWKYILTYQQWLFVDSRIMDYLHFLFCALSYFLNVLQRACSILVTKMSMQKKRKKFFVVFLLFLTVWSLSRFSNLWIHCKIFFSTKYSMYAWKACYKFDCLWLGDIASAQPSPSLIDGPTKQHCVLGDHQKFQCRLSIFTYLIELFLLDTASRNRRDRNKKIECWEESSNHSAHFVWKKRMIYFLRKGQHPVLEDSKGNFVITDTP